MGKDEKEESEIFLEGVEEIRESWFYEENFFKYIFIFTRILKAIFYVNNQILDHNNIEVKLWDVKQKM